MLHSKSGPLNTPVLPPPLLPTHKLGHQLELTKELHEITPVLISQSNARIFGDIRHNLLTWKSLWVSQSLLHCAYLCVDHIQGNITLQVLPRSKELCKQIAAQPFSQNFYRGNNSGISLIQTPLRPKYLSWLVRCPYFRGRKVCI